MISTQIPTIVIFGRTGSGKSALGNRILNDHVFEEGDTLESKTVRTESIVDQWQKNPYLDICVVDTPGLADINAERGPEIILQDILEFLCELKDGFNIAIYCLSSTKLRFDKYDKDELQVMGTLLGNEVFSHTFIALTQVDRLNSEIKEQTIKKFCKELPPILEDQVFLKGFNDKILISDFANFDPFLRSLDKLLKTCQSYYPMLADGLDPTDPDSIRKLMDSPQIQKLLKKYEQIIEDQYNYLRTLNRQIEDQAMTNQVYQKLIQDQEEKIKELQKMLSELRSNPDYSGVLFYPYYSELPVMSYTDINSLKKRNGGRKSKDSDLKLNQNLSPKKDHRLKENRSNGLNADGRKDRRLKENRSDGLNADGSKDRRLKENRSDGLNADGSKDFRFKENRSDDLNTDGSKDHRLKENRSDGLNADGSKDRRLKENRSDGLNADGSKDLRFKENRAQRLNIMDGALDIRYTQSKLVQSTSSKEQLTTSNVVQNFKSLATDTNNLLKTSNSVPLKTNGTPDVRYSVNRQTFTVPDQTAHTIGPLKKDGTPDLRYSVNKQASSFTGPNQNVHTTGPLKHDGTLDMRYSVNKQAVSSMTSTQANTATGKATSGTSGHAGKTGGSHASAGGGKSSAGSCSASCGSGGKSGGGKSHK